MKMKTEKQWMEEDDAETLARAEAIKSDPTRMKGAKAGAKRLQVEAAKRAKEAQKKATVIKKIAKTPVKKSSSKKTVSKKKK